jgi:hypothetical protein
VLKKKILDSSNNYRTVYKKDCQKALKHMVFGSGINLFRIPYPGVKKAPDPGSGSATLLPTSRCKKRPQKNCQKALKHKVLGSGNRDPKKTYSGSLIPDPRVKKAPDPGSGSATLLPNSRFPPPHNSRK